MIASVPPHQPVAPSATPGSAASAFAAPAIPSPSNNSPGDPAPSYVEYTFDSRLGIPVLEVVNAKGSVEQSYPSQQQLQAYATAASPKASDSAPGPAKLSSTA